MDWVEVWFAAHTKPVSFTGSLLVVGGYQTGDDRFNYKKDGFLPPEPQDTKKTQNLVCSGLVGYAILQGITASSSKE
jgi:hypothetical protein